ncbi:MAG: phosphotransferase family protein [Betaproteobacteria bacterium HGW-Betaproteobacteria-12]|nr:MAG: phosphotransferase family protein [Betaproteobacteria bacterium HGW-Betaproteobacteria-12]
MNRIDKDRPTHDWIEQLRRRFPCEREIDRVLTRKLQRRAGPPYAPVSLETLVQGTEALIRSELDAPFEILEANWLSGGASKLQMAFKLKWHQPGVGPALTPMVLRMEPSESITETSRLREYQVIKAVEGYLPVPPTYWVDAEGRFLPYPAIVYGFAPGVAKPSASSSGVSGVGTFMPESVRAPLGAQYVEHLAKLHTFDWRQARLDAFDKPAGPTQALEWQLNRWERVWEEDINEDVPLMRLTMAWLRKNMPALDHVSLIHGDYRVGNFLFTEEDNRISAWLDWELSYLGDRHEDLCWATKEAFGHLAEDGKTFLVGGLMPREEFFAAYEKSSGLSVCSATLRYYELFNNYKCVAICLATGCRATRNGKTHQDVLVAWLSGISYTLLDELRRQLEEVL